MEGLAMISHKLQKGTRIRCINDVGAYALTQGLFYLVDFYERKLGEVYVNVIDCAAGDRSGGWCLERFVPAAGPDYQAPNDCDLRAYP